MKSEIWSLVYLCVLMNALHLQSVLDLYLNNDELEKEAQTIADHWNLNLNSCEEDSRIKYFELGETQNKQATPIIIICNIHARQIITAQTCLYWINHFMSMSSLVKKVRVRLFFDANINRRKIFQGQQTMRKNQNGVDLNRNFPTQFNYYHVKKSSPIYGGPHPISQPFTRCLNKMLVEEIPSLFLDLHSGGNGEIFYQGEDEYKLVQKLNEKICKSQCRVTTLKKDGESINGHIFADIKQRLKAKFSILFEIYGNQKANSTISLFNPSTKQEKKAIMKKWSRGITITIQEVLKLL